MSQQTYPAGGAYGLYNSQTIRSADDWKIEDDLQLFQVNSNTRGKIEDRAKNLMGKLTCSPRVFLSTLIAQLGLFVPYLDPALVGTTIFPASDLPFVVQTKDGKSITYSKAAIGKMPDVVFHPAKRLLGSAEFTLLVATGAAMGASASYDAEAASAYTEPAETLGTEYQDTYSMTFGTGGGAITLVADKDGITVKPTVKLEEIQPGMEPTRNYRITEVGCTVEFRPLTMDCDTFYQTFAQLSTGTNAPVLGGPIASTGAQLVIQSATGASGSGKLKCTIPMVSRSKGGIEASNKNPRIAKVTLEAQQTYSAGAWQPLLSFAAL
jgi:hypothetical protein